MGLFSGAKGRKPVPWNHTLANPYTDGHRPDDVTREGQLLKRLAWGQYVAVAALLVALGTLWSNWRLADRVQEKIRPYVVEVAETGQIRNVGILPQAPFAMPGTNVPIYVIRYWLWTLRSVGDSKVLQGQAWENVLAFTADRLAPWVREQIGERYKIFEKRQTVQISQILILPVDAKQRQFRATWTETTYAMSGEPVRRAQWEATFSLLVSPPPTIQANQQWKNPLGVLVAEVHWLELTTKGPTS
jgi:type IV secretory pathway TrbF-like protein